MRHTSRKRAAPDPLAPVDAPTWLVVRNGVGFVLEASELLGADLRSVLAAARETRISVGWAAEEICTLCAFFFTTRDGVRLMIGIERRPPRDRLTCRECG